MNDKDHQLFQILIEKFSDEHKFYSFVDTDDATFRYLVAWGKTIPQDIIPRLIKIIREDWAWSAALWEIVGEANGPFIAAEDAGRFDAIVTAWQEWAKAKGYN